MEHTVGQKRIIFLCAERLYNQPLARLFHFHFFFGPSRLQHSARTDLFLDAPPHGHEEGGHTDTEQEDVQQAGGRPHQGKLISGHFQVGNSTF